MPNTTVRAAAEGMPSINRRHAMLGAGATAAALAVTSLPAEPATADAELFQLGEKMEAAHARWEQACKAMDGASERYNALKASFLGSQVPPEPIPLPEKFRGLVHGEFLTVGEAHILEKVAPNHPLLVWHRGEMDRVKRLRAEQDESLAKLSREHAELKAAGDAVEADTETLFAIAERVFAIPASTVAGMLVKLRVDQMQEVHGEDEVSDEASASIAADIKRLAGAAS
jgi:hypothetical protein